MSDSILEHPEKDLWVLEGPTVDFYGFPYPTRMVVLRLEGNRLWVWSPIALTPELRAQVDQLGSVTWLVTRVPQGKAVTGGVWGLRVLSRQ